MLSSFRSTDSNSHQCEALGPLEHLCQVYGSEGTGVQMDDDDVSNDDTGCNQTKENGISDVLIPGPSQAPGWTCTNMMTNFQGDHEVFPSVSIYPGVGDGDEMAVDVPCSGPSWEGHTQEPHNDSVCLTRYHIHWEGLISLGLQQNVGVCSRNNSLFKRWSFCAYRLQSTFGGK